MAPDARPSVFHLSILEVADSLILVPHLHRCLGHTRVHFANLSKPGAVGPSNRDGFVALDKGYRRSTLEHMHSDNRQKILRAALVFATKNENGQSEPLAS